MSPLVVKHDRTIAGIGTTMPGRSGRCAVLVQSMHKRRTL
jgi:hypothetical protein